MTILLATLLATSLVAHLIHFLVFRNKFYLSRRSLIDEIVKLKNDNDSYSVRISGQFESKDREIQSLKDDLRIRLHELERMGEKCKEVDALRQERESMISNYSKRTEDWEVELKTAHEDYYRIREELQKRAENELKRISESSKEIDTLKALNNDLKLKAVCASDLYNVELEKHKATIETLQNNFASYKAEKEAKIDKLNEELTAAKVRYENIYGMLRNGAKETELTLQRKIDSLRTLLNGVVKHKDKKIKALESECLECQRSLERLTSQGNQKTALIEDLRTQLNRNKAGRLNLHASDALEIRDLEAKDKEIERLTELVGSYKLVSDEVSKADTDRRNKVNSLINYTSMGGLTKTETIAKLQALI